MGSPLLGRHIVNLVTQLEVIAGAEFRARGLLWTREGGVNREELLTSIAATRPGRDDTVYLERRGTEYDWQLMPAGAKAAMAVDRCRAPMCGCRSPPRWPVDDPDRLRVFFDDVIAELESMAGGADRCRWPIDRAVAAFPLTDAHRGLPDHTRGPHTVQALPAAVGFRLAVSPRSRARRSIESSALASGIQGCARGLLLPGNVGLATRAEAVAGAQGDAAVVGGRGRAADLERATALLDLLRRLGGDHRRLRPGQDPARRDRPGCPTRAIPKRVC